jgi:predicted DNA-binding transcriptional regulator AlpA
MRTVQGAIINPVSYAVMQVLPVAEFIGKAEVCKVLGVSTRTLDREIARGRFPRPFKVGSRSKFTHDQLAEYVNLLAGERMDRERNLEPGA